MKRHLNTLFVTTDETYLSKEGEAVAVRQDGNTAMRIPIHMLQSIVCLGHVGVSPYLMALCARRGVSVSFLTQHGRFLGRVSGATSGNVLLRKSHFRLSEDPIAAFELARVFVRAKIHNCRVVVMRAARDHGDSDGLLDTTSERLANVLQRTKGTETLDGLRGLEGEAARQYFQTFPVLIRSADTAFAMHGRSRRPPQDPVNALLSFAYGILRSDVQAACESAGLDPQIGFLHADRSGRPALALDLMEELRPVLAERVVLSLINRQQVRSAGFVTDMGGGVRMEEETRKTVLAEYQARKNEELEHPFLGEKVTLGLVPLLQARLLARTIRRELDAYPAFLWR